VFHDNLTDNEIDNFKTHLKNKKMIEDLHYMAPYQQIEMTSLVWKKCPHKVSIYNKQGQEVSQITSRSLVNDQGDRIVGYVDYTPALRYNRLV
jgi:hypothetical protein